MRSRLVASVATLALIASLVATDFYFREKRKRVVQAVPVAKSTLAPLPKFDPSIGRLPLDVSKHGAMVRLHDKLTGRFFCTGSVIDRHYVLTAAHCVDDRPMQSGGIIIKTVEGNSTGIELGVAGADSRGDIALLVGDVSQFNALRVAWHAADIIGQINESKRVLTCGFPHGGKSYCTPLTYIGPYFFQFEMTGGYLFPGMSGGPSFDAITGDVIAVTTGGFQKSLLLSPIIEIFASFGVEIESQ